MKKLEKQLIAGFNYVLQFYKRNVDDFLVILTNNLEYSQYASWLVHHGIQFTIEIDHQNSKPSCLGFTHDENGKLKLIGLQRIFGHNSS